MLDLVKFFRRRQFVLGPEHVEYDGWKKLSLAEDIRVTVHPDLTTTALSNGINKGILIGYAIDPSSPESTDRDVLERLIDGEVTIGGTVNCLNPLCGRFVLLLSCPSGDLLFHDAVALRQVNYCRDSRGKVWCASQAETLAEINGFGYDQEVLAFRNMPKYKASKEGFWMLNNRTPFGEVMNLLPNHFLDLRTGKSSRYWPVAGCIKPLSPDESVELCSGILKNSIKAAARRFDLKMAISAGADSRKTLAATKEVRDRILYFTHTPTQRTDLVKDVEIPRKLLPKLGLAHHFLGWQEMDNEFRLVYERNNPWGREWAGHIAFNLLKHLGPDTTVMNSNISEVAQDIYWLPKWRIDGLGLAILTGLKHPFAVTEFQNWVDGARASCLASGMFPLNLFFLEQRMGRWATAAFGEYDIAHETFNPYNNRNLHCLMLGVDEKYRKDRRWEMNTRQIKYMWPEVLSEPINTPVHLRNKLQQFIRRKIIHKALPASLPVYEYLRYIRLKHSFNNS